jgi:hypothetical protein
MFLYQKSWFVQADDEYLQAEFSRYYGAGRMRMRRFDPPLGANIELRGIPIAVYAIALVRGSAKRVI